MPSCLPPKWLCDNSCTWAHEVRLHIARTNESKMTIYISEMVFHIVQAPTGTDKPEILLGGESFYGAVDT